MAEYTNSNIVTVAAGQNVPLTETPAAGGGCIVHRAGAGIVTLRGLTNQCKARFRVSFGANIAIPTGGTVEAISAALAINGEARQRLSRLRRWRTISTSSSRHL